MIASLYFLTLLVVVHREVLFAKVPGDDVPLHVPERWEIGLIVGVKLALVLATWVLTRKYTQSLLEEGTDVRAVPDAGPVASH